MRIAGLYSFNKGKEYVEKVYTKELKEIFKAIKSVNANDCKTKVSKEKTMKDKMLYSPVALNEEFKKFLFPLKWKR